MPRLEKAKPEHLRGMVFIVLFGHLLLGEGIRLRHVVMLAFASIGVAIIMRPEHTSACNSYLFLPLLSAPFFALNIILTRKLGNKEHPLRRLCQDGGVAFVLPMH